LYRYDTSADPPAPILPIKLSNPYNPSIRAIDVKALIDSGAFMSVIPEDWVGQLGLLPIGDQDTHGYKQGLQNHRTYLVQVSFENMSFGVEVMAVKRSNMLIGRDVLNTLKLVLDGKNLYFEILDP
jgi:predicted aspartyl protease